MLNIPVTNEEPTSGHNDVCSVDRPKTAFWEKCGQNDSTTTFSSSGRHGLLVSKRTLCSFGGWWSGCIISEGQTPGPVSGSGLNVGGWLTNGDMALDSCAQFLAVAEHRLIPATARSIGRELRKADRQSVRAPAYQDQLSGGRAGVGVISLCGASFNAPSLATLEFGEFFGLCRALSGCASHW